MSDPPSQVQRASDELRDSEPSDPRDRLSELERELAELRERADRDAGARAQAEAEVERLRMQLDDRAAIAMQFEHAAAELAEAEEARRAVERELERVRAELAAERGYGIEDETQEPPEFDPELPEFDPEPPGFDPEPFELEDGPELEDEWAVETPADLPWPLLAALSVLALGALAGILVLTGVI